MIDFLKKIKNTNKFRKPALLFIKTGSYCMYPAGTTSYFDYWDEEERRCLEGYIAEDGDYITGHHYFYLNYCPIIRLVYKDIQNLRTGNTSLRGITELTFPDFYDYDYFFFEALEMATDELKHLCVLKSRRKGYSYKMAAVANRNYYFKPKSITYIYASNKQYLTGDGILSKAWSYMDHIDKHTAWAKKRIVSTTMHRKSGYKSRNEMGNEIDDGFLSEIQGVSVKDNPDVVRGKRGEYIIWEEAGSCSELAAGWQIARPSLEQDGYTFGTMIAFGTGGDEGCLTENTKVFTEDGRRISVKDVLVNDKIIGYDEVNKTVKPLLVSNVHNTKYKECVKITTNTGRDIECSEDHPILASNSKDINDCLEFGWRDAGDLLQDDYVAIASNIGYFGEACIENARAVGMVIGDGSYGKNTSVRYYTCDEELKTHIKKLYNCRLLDSYTTKSGKQMDSYRVLKMKHLLNKLGIGGQTKTDKRLPDAVFSANKETVCELIGGLYDTGGSVTTTFNKQRNEYSTIINMAQSSKELLKQLLILLNKLGIHGYIYKVKARTSSSGICGSGHYSLDIHDVESIKMFHNQIKFLCQYKQESLDNGVLRMSNIKPLKKYRGFVYERISKIEKIGLQKVYNFTTETNHTYIANGVITHNSAFATLKDMFYRPDAYNCLGFDNIWDEFPTDKKCGFFIPLYTNLDTRDKDGKRIFMDEDGNTRKKASLDFILSERRKMIESATNQKAIDRYVAERCLTPLEAMLEFLGNIFPKRALQEQLAKIRTSQAITNSKQVGDLIFNSEGKLNWLIRKSGDIVKFPLDKNDDPTGAIVIWEHPSLTATPGLYIIGVDPYDHDKAGTNSLGSTFVYKRMLGFEKNYDVIVAEYTGRPERAEDYYENVRKLSIYYNAKVMYENERKGIFPYFTSKYCDYLLADQPKIISDIVNTSTVERRKGCHMNKQIKEYAEGMIKDWLNEEYEPGRKILTEIKSEPLLEELISYNDRGNFDRVMALALVMIYRLELANLKVRLVDDEYKKAVLFEGPIFAQNNWFYDDRPAAQNLNVFTFNNNS